MDRIHVVAFRAVVLVYLPVQVPKVEEAVCNLGAVVLRIESGSALVLILLINVEHLVGDAVLQEYVLAEFLYRLLQGVYLHFEAVVFLFELASDQHLGTSCYRKESHQCRYQNYLYEVFPVHPLTEY